METFKDKLVRFSEFLQSPILPDDYTRVPSRSRPGMTSYCKIDNGKVSFRSTTFPMEHDLYDLILQAAYNFYVQEIIHESISMEGMELTELVYAGEMQDTLYELVKIEMKKDRFLSDQEKSINFEAWILSRKTRSL